MNPSISPPSVAHSQIASLLRDLRDDTSTLLQQELALAKAEMSEKVSRMASNALQFAIGGFVLYAGVIIILFGLADLVASLLIRAGLSAEISVWLSHALFGLLVALTGWGMIAKAQKSISTQNPLPEKTIKTFGENKEWMEQKL